MKLASANIAAFIVGLAALIGALVLVGLHDVVPGYVWAIAIAGLTAGAGLSVPGGAPTATLNDLATVLPALAPRLEVDLKQLAVEVLHQLSTPAAAPVPVPVAVTPTPSAAAVAASIAPFVPPPAAAP